MRKLPMPGRLILCLTAVYVLWGSSFIFTKIASTHFPVFAFSSLRFLTAGTLLMSVSLIVNREPFPRRWLDWRHALIVGFCMIFVSNGLNGWGIRYIPTHQSALLNGTVAFWIAGLGTLGPRGHPLSRRAVLGLSIGFLGTALVLVPKGSLHADHAWAQLAILGAALAFSLGTLYYRSVDTAVSSLMFMSMQIMCGGVMHLSMALARGDFHNFDWDPTGLLAVGYLAFFSSSLTFAAYGWLMRNATPTVIGSYSYVNPAVAAFLGWQFLNETLSPLQLLGMGVVIGGVALLTLPGSTVAEPKALQEPKTQ